MSASRQLGKLAASLGVALTLSTGTLLAADHATHKHEHAGAPVSMALNEGKKWATDEALRKGMENIRNLMDASLHRIHQGKLSNAGYATLAKEVNDELGNIVANCKLDPKADAQLHLVVADIAEGIEAMEGKTKKVKRQSGAVKVLGALEKYAGHFDHPGWKAITH